MTLLNPYRFAAGADSLLTGLVSWWSLNEASGNRADSHGSNTLTDNNTVTSDTGKQGSAASFASSNQEYLSVAAGHGLHASDRDFTCCYWVRPAALAENQSYIACGAQASAPNTDYFSGYNASVSRFHINIPVGGSYNRLDANNFGAPSINTWYFVLFYHDSAANTIGIQVNNGTANTLGSITPNNTGGAFYIGSWVTTIQTMDGRIDEPAFWTRLLTTDEKTRLYNSGSGMAYPG